jgi:hypothetical protein
MVQQGQFKNKKRFISRAEYSGNHETSFALLRPLQMQIPPHSAIKSELDDCELLDQITSGYFPKPQSCNIAYTNGRLVSKRSEVSSRRGDQAKRG